MTTISFFKKDDKFYGFEENGHSDFDELGKDILCASLSSMTMLIVNTIEISYASDVKYEIDENKAKITVYSTDALKDNNQGYAISGLFQGYYYQLMDLLEDYYDYLDVNVIQK